MKQTMVLAGIVIAVNMLSGRIYAMASRRIPTSIQAARDPAVKGVLLRNPNPRGCLPETFEKRCKDAPAYGHFPGRRGAVPFAEGLFVSYRWFDKKTIAPRFPFGFGLSYTTFQLGGLELFQRGVGRDRMITVRVSVTHTGRRAGTAIIQLYIHPIPGGAIERVVQKLEGFQGVELRPGPTRQVSMRLDWKDFAGFNGQTNTWFVPPGRYEIGVGTSSRDEPLARTISWPSATP